MVLGAQALLAKAASRLSAGYCWTSPSAGHMKEKPLEAHNDEIPQQGNQALEGFPAGEQVRAWKPNVTVAAVAYRDGRFLLVEEETAEGLRFNQPAGHLERGESLVEAVRRECREETGYDFEPRALLGIYQWPRPKGEVTYLRFAFVGEIVGHDPERPLDTGIIAPHWLTIDAMRAEPHRHRSPLILRCAEDHLAGRRFPLDVIIHYG
jgi:8-oxo-dGTP pyrophosphatase MutT (NUDIX family)